jgi:hypothetical protein
MLRYLWSPCLALSLAACTTPSEKEAEKIQNDTQEVVDEIIDTKILAAHSPKTIGKEDPITVLFTKDMITEEEKKNTPTGFFKFSPSIEGEIRWISNREIHFVPKTALKENQNYRVELDLKQLDKKITENNPSFSVSVKGQKFWFSHKDLHVSDAGSSSVTGNINTVYPIDTETAQKLLIAKQEQADLVIEWQELSTLKYTFTVQGIKRQKMASNVALVFSGAAIGLDEKYTRSIKVPAKNQLTLLSVVPNNDENYIELRFSDNIVTESKDLKKLIQVPNYNDLRFIVENNII